MFIPCLIKIQLNICPKIENTIIFNIFNLIDSNQYNCRMSSYIFPLIQELSSDWLAGKPRICEGCTKGYLGSAVNDFYLDYDDLDQSQNQSSFKPKS